ncbi:MAG: elongation factor G, partial [Deltaproteobacteria bacterium]|nr:elongation factor G [Deltaproteobacteria bacterium]
EDELQSGLHAAFQNQTIIPVFCAAAQQNIGTKRIMDFIATYGSSPLDRPKLTAVDGDGKEAGEISLDDPNPTLYVFKTVSEAHLGDLSFFRVISGKVSAGMDLYNITRRKNERIGQLLLFNGKNRTSVDELSAGDIGTTVKLKDTHSGDTLGDSKSELIVPPCHFPTPSLHFAIKPKSKSDEDKIGVGLATLHGEDPAFEYWVDRDVKQTMIAGQGELHLQIAVEKLKRRFNVEVDIEAPRIPYRETVRGKGDSKYRHKKQTGGAGQFAEVWLTVEALPRGSGVEFTQTLVGQNVDRTFVPSVEKGVMAMCESGVIVGCRVVDVKATFYDGKQHPVDSKDIAFQIAGRGAFKEAFLAAKPCLLEPIYNITVKVPEEYMGAVMGDVSGRRGKILGMDAEGKFQIVKAQVPEADLYQYATTLRSITGGRGIYKREFSHYAEMPKELEAKVIAAAKEDREEKEE